MSTERNKAIVRQYLAEAWDGRDPGAVERFMTEDYTNLNPPPGTGGRRADEVALVAGFLKAFGAFRSTIELQVADGNAVFTRWSAVGRHQATFMGVPATGREVPMRGAELAHLRDDRIASIHPIFDAASLMRELGAAPDPAPAAIADPAPAVPARGADSPERRRTAAREFLEALWYDPRGGALEDLVRSDAVGRGHLMPSGAGTGPRALEALAAGVRGAFPDLRVRVTEVLVDGDHVVALCAATGTSAAPFLGLPASGRPVAWTEFALLTIAGGAVLEARFDTDLAAIMGQLAPRPAGATG